MIKKMIQYITVGAIISVGGLFAFILSLLISNMIETLFNRTNIIDIIGIIVILLILLAIVLLIFIVIGFMVINGIGKGD